MTLNNLREIAEKLNVRSSGFQIGSLQEIRLNLGLTSRKVLKHPIYNLDKVRADWAHHFGGRKELQFNIGFENQELRYGVAFSLETSQSLHSIDDLIPKIMKFNEFQRINPELYSDMKMWHYHNGVRSSDRMSGPISADLMTIDTFVFLGKLQSLDSLNIDAILHDFDRLLPLYVFVEGQEHFPKTVLQTISGFQFRPGCTIKASSAFAKPAERLLDVTLRHNDLQLELYRRLVAEFGKDNVGTELMSGIGTSVDVIVKKENGYWFYEIKTGLSARACIRQALGQLLEYSFWPGAQEASRLIVVGEPSLNKEEEEYIHTLRDKFHLPIDYVQITSHIS